MIPGWTLLAQSSTHRLVAREPDLAATATAAELDVPSLHDPGPSTSQLEQVHLIRSNASALSSGE